MVKTKRYTQTDIGNAEFFAAMYKDKVKYDHARRKWLIWKSPLWCVDKMEEVSNLASEAMRERYEAAKGITNPIIKDSEKKWARLSESMQRISAILRLARARPDIATAGDEWDTDQYLLGCKNAIVDLRTGKALKPDPKLLITMSTGIDFDPDATCPRWEQFLSEVMPDEEVRDYVSKVAGYSLTGNTREQILTCLYGLGGNGKSIFLDTLISALGDYGHTMPFAAIEFKERGQISNDIAAMVRRRFVVASETQEDVRLNEGRIKSLTGCERITCRFLFQESFSYYPSGHYWLAFNHKPIVMDNTEGFWRRLKLLTFSSIFNDASTGKKRDKQLDEKLRAELPGILAWAVRQCLAWQKDGLKEPAAILNDTRQYREESNPLLEFLEEEYIFDPAGSVTKGEIYRDYIAYCRNTGERYILGKKTFGNTLKSMGIFEKKNNNCRYWVGIRPSTIMDVKMQRNQQVTVN